MNRTFSNTSLKRTYYEVLGVHNSATRKQIKSAYLKLAKSLHPDLHEGKRAKQLDESNNNHQETTPETTTDDDDTTEEFKSVTEAYEVLSDVDARKQYDAQVLKLFEGSDYYFGQAKGFTASNSDFSRFKARTVKPGKKKMDAEFLQRFKEELEYRRKRRYMSGIELDDFDLSNRKRHFFRTSQLFFDQFKPPKIKNWSSSLTQDARARSIRMKQILLLFLGFVATFGGLIALRVNMIRWFDLPRGSTYQTLLFKHYTDNGVKFGRRGMDDGLPDHKL